MRPNFLSLFMTKWWRIWTWKGHFTTSGLLFAKIHNKPELSRDSLIKMSLSSTISMFLSSYLPFYHVFIPNFTIPFDQQIFDRPHQGVNIPKFYGYSLNKHLWNAASRSRDKSVQNFTAAQFFFSWMMIWILIFRSIWVNVCAREFVPPSGHKRAQTTREILKLTWQDLRSIFDCFNFLKALRQIDKNGQLTSLKFRQKKKSDANRNLFERFCRRKKKEQNEKTFAFNSECSFSIIRSVEF